MRWVYVVYWFDSNDELKNVEIFTNKKAAKECCNYIRKLGGLSAYWLEELMKENIDWIDEEYFKRRAKIK